MTNRPHDDNTLDKYAQPDALQIVIDLLTPIAEREWDGKWRIKRALEMLDMYTKSPFSIHVAETCKQTMRDSPHIIGSHRQPDENTLKTVLMAMEQANVSDVETTLIPDGYTMRVLAEAAIAAMKREAVCRYKVAYEAYHFYVHASDVELVERGMSRADALTVANQADIDLEAHQRRG